MKRQKQTSIYSGKICPYCSQKSEYVDSSEVYGKSYGMIYLCRPCKAWSGVHKGTKMSLGSLANSELREWRKEAHLYFDKLWRAKIKFGHTKNEARGKAYAWLAASLGIPDETAHIAWFDVEMCKKAVNLCKPIADRINI